MISCTFENGGKGKLRHVTVDSIVLRGDEILLHRRSKKLNEGGKWSLAGGFLGRDETVTEGAKREIFEETGYRMKDLILFRIIDNPNRPKEDRQNISFVFFGQAGAKEGESDWEAEELTWFKLDDLPSKDQFAFDHYDNIEVYLEYSKNPCQLPLFNN